jgi:hypothetical protein
MMDPKAGLESSHLEQGPEGTELDEIKANNLPPMEYSKEEEEKALRKLDWCLVSL